MTRDEIEAFQVAHANHLGKPLRVDGDIGPQTEWALDFATLCVERRAIIRAGQPFIGLSEEPPGSNSDLGGVIRAWLTRCGAPHGAPWCAAFASWCLSQGGGPPVRQAGAQALGRSYPATTQPLTGDLFWYPTDAQGHGHVGLVLGVSAAEIMTLEGNCGNAVRVARRDRAGLRFARTIDDTSGTPPGVVPTVLPPPGATR